MAEARNLARARHPRRCAPSWPYRAVLAAVARRLGGGPGGGALPRRVRAVLAAARRLGARHFGGCALSWRLRRASAPCRRPRAVLAVAGRYGGYAPSRRLARRPGGCASSWRLRRLGASALSRGMRSAAVARARLAGGRRAVLVPSWQTRAVSADARRLGGCAALSLACRAGCAPPLRPRAPGAPRARVGRPASYHPPR